MTLKETLNNALKEAMKSKDNDRRDSLRLLTSALKQAEIDTRRDVTDQEALDILQKEAKKRRESITELAKAGRADQQAQEAYELGVIEEFLPKQLSRDEIIALIQAAIAQTGAAGAKEMGKVMGVLQPQVKGRADGKLVSELVKELLDK
ncbi:MAG: GatB/YqeY domain-containing protein [Anaerolineae bacterium]|nr:GatB/YqeY domain-containing protein [Anaerolineae bacterium]